MIDTALPALVLAWTTTMIATTMFAAALAVSHVCDSATYFRGLERVLCLDG